MPKRPPVLALLALLAALPPAPAHAWGPLAHKAIARLAQRRLSPAASAEIRGLLGPTANLEDIANCPDTMRYTADPTLCGGVFTVPGDKQRKTAPWHQIDIPITESPTMATLSKYCANGDCVVEQIGRQAAALADKTAS